MKIILIAAIGFWSIVGFSQTSVFWFQPNIFNPATAGFFNRFAVNNYSEISQFNGVNIANSTFNYNQALKKLHGGIGWTYNYQDRGLKNHNFDINYSYHLVKKENFAFSGGLNIGYGRINGQFDCPTCDLFPFEKNYFRLGIGIVARYKAHTIQAVFKQDRMNDIHFKSNIIHLIYGFDHKFNEDWSMNLNLMFQRLEGGFQDIVFSPIVKYKMFWLNPGFRNRDGLIIGGGIDIKEQIRAGLSYNVTVSALNNGISRGNYGVILSYRIKHN